MKQAIVVPTAPGREMWVHDLMKSLDRDALILSMGGWETGKLQWIIDHTDLDEFFFLQDSCVVHDASFIDEMFSIPGPVSLTECPVIMGMFLGKYTRETLGRIEIPKCVTKRDSIDAEVTWNPRYAEGLDIPVMFPDLHDKNATRQEFRHGRINLVLENEYITKYKGTWK